MTTPMPIASSPTNNNTPTDGTVWYPHPNPPPGLTTITSPELEARRITPGVAGTAPPVGTSSSSSVPTAATTTTTTAAAAAASSSASSSSSAQAVPLATVPLPHIRIVPHLDAPRSLHFEVVDKDVPEGFVLKIGRFTDKQALPNRVTFKSKVVSRGHAEIYTELGKFYIRDTKSSSGTFLNHARLSPPGVESKPTQLKDGDVVQLGVDYQGGTQEIYRCVKMRLELNRSWQQQANPFRTNTLKAIRSLTTATASASTDCCICLFRIASFQSLFVAPCSHVFHYKCIRPLLVTNHPGFLCPLCRTFADLEDSVEIDDPIEEDMPVESAAQETSAPETALAREERVVEEPQPVVGASAINALSQRSTTTNSDSANRPAGSGTIAPPHQNLIAPTTASPSLLLDEEFAPTPPSEQAHTFQPQARSTFDLPEGYVNGSSSQQSRPAGAGGVAIVDAVPLPVSPAAATAAIHRAVAVAAGRDVSDEEMPLAEEHLLESSESAEGEREGGSDSDDSGHRASAAEEDLETNTRTNTATMSGGAVPMDIQNRASELSLENYQHPAGATLTVAGIATTPQSPSAAFFMAPSPPTFSSQFGPVPVPFGSSSSASSSSGSQQQSQQQQQQQQAQSQRHQRSTSASATSGRSQSQSISPSNHISAAGHMIQNFVRNITVPGRNRSRTNSNSPLNPVIIHHITGGSGAGGSGGVSFAPGTASSGSSATGSAGPTTATTTTTTTGGGDLHTDVFGKTLVVTPPPMMLGIRQVDDIGVVGGGSGLGSVSETDQESMSTTGNGSEGSGSAIVVGQEVIQEYGESSPRPMMSASVEGTA